MAYPRVNISYKGGEYYLTWIRTDSIKNYSPITQVYGVCFDSNKKILIARSSNEAQWQIPGGTPEKGETYKQTLKRELLEETDVEVEDIKILGVQRVEVPNQPKRIHYQLRCICNIKHLLAQTADPAKGKVWERKLVESNEVTKYVKWGKTGEAIFTDAIKLHTSS